MSMTRRNFLRGMLAAATAPAIVKAEHIMRIRPLESGLLVPDSGLTVGTVQIYEDRIIKQIEERIAAVEQDLDEQFMEFVWSLSPAEVPFPSRPVA